MSLLLKSKISVCLNALETLSTAWRLGVVDRTVFFEEFHAVFQPKGNQKLLYNYRDMLGIYPSIKLFDDWMTENKERPLLKIELVKSKIWDRIL